MVVGELFFTAVAKLNTVPLADLVHDHNRQNGDENRDQEPVPPSPTVENTHTHTHTHTSGCDKI